MRPSLRVFCLSVAFVAACFPDPNKLRFDAGAPNPGLGGVGGGQANLDASLPGAADGAVTQPGRGGAGGTVAGTGGAAGGTGGAAGDAGGPRVDAMPDAPGPSAMEACNAYADATVDMMNRCAPLLVQLLYGTQATAQQRLRLLCRFLDVPGVNFPKRPIGPCLQALRVFSCADWFDNRTPIECQAPGDYPAGTPCTVGDQCQSSYCDLTTPVAGCGQCAPPLPAAGGACFQGQYCAAGLVCAPNLTCVELRDLGAACNINQPCRASLVCRGGFCARRGAPGAVCATRADCDEAGGAICNPNMGVCVPYRVGMPCGVQADGSGTICPAAGTCQPLTRTCQPAAAEGAACDQTNGPNCLNPAACVNGTCQLPVINPACRRAPASTRENATGLPLGFAGSLRALFTGSAQNNVPR